MEGVDRITQLQGQIIVHSIIYYELNSSIWTDTQFDNACKELVSLGPEKGRYGDLFKGWKGETGHDLPSKASARLWDVARRLLEYGS